MQRQEKKYKVDSFDEIKKVLGELGAHPVKTSSSYHYYAVQPGLDVTKLVVHNDRSEIHILAEDAGKYTLTENIPVPNKLAGLRWLIDNDFKEVSIIHMTDTDYSYKDGIIGLYTINNILNSVILDFTPGQHEAIAKEFGLDKSEVIDVPYNVYLQQRGRLKNLPLSDIMFI